MGAHRTCGEPDEIQKNTHPRYITARFCYQANGEEVADKGLYAKVSPLAANRFAVNPFLCTTLIHHVKKGYSTTDGVKMSLSANWFAAMVLRWTWR